MLGLGFWLALLVGACLTPTDPILAGPLEEDSPEEDPEDRFGLSTEAGLNDGFAFPFIYLGLFLTLPPHDVGAVSYTHHPAPQTRHEKVFPHRS
jgi:NhaP-type Na+/H+ or K+/H+ antiporter